MIPCTGLFQGESGGQPKGRFLADIGTEYRDWFGVELNSKGTWTVVAQHCS